MKKNMFKRAWLNIIRKPSKTIILFIIMFVIANLVLASLAISNAVDESTDYAKETIGSDVYLNVDMEKTMESMGGMRQPGGSQNQGNNGGNISLDDIESLMVERPTIDVSMVLDLANSSYVRDFSYQTSIIVSPGNYTEYETSSMMNRLKGGVTAINSYAFIEEVSNNTIEIIEGTYFDEQTEDSLIISYELAILNDFYVGDTITFINNDEGEISYTIIGIFTSTTEGYENNIYMNVTSSEKLMTETQYNNGDYSVSNVIYYLNNPDDTEKFKEEASMKYDFETLSLTLDIDNEAYEQMAGPIESVGSFSDTILITVIIAAILIISLIINNQIKDRKYEIGVLMSLGASKLNIIGQFLIELVIIATVGFIISIGTSTFIATTLSDSLLENQLQIEEEAVENNFGRPQISNMINILQGNSDVEVIDEIDVSIEVKEYILLFTIGYMIVILSMIIPVINILKYEPKTILTGRE